MSTHSREWWQKISPYLDEALGMEDEQRASWLASLRAKDPALVSDLESLLHEHQQASDEQFLEKGPASILPVEAAMPGKTLGAYTLMSLVGEGGMGNVWLAERSDGRFQGRAAVKVLRVAVLDHTAGERFKREGTILARLAHPHIARLLDAGVSASGQPFIVLEYIDGQDIVTYCDQRRLDLVERLRLFLDVLSALAHAHANLIVHRDIKPSNVFVRTDGQVKLLDFGIAKLLEAESAEGAATQLTREGGAALTPQYAAPEQVTGGLVTVATDVYAAGVLLYILLTGQHPTGAGPHSPAELIKAIIDTETQSPSRAMASDRDRAKTVESAAANRSSNPEKLRRLLRGDLDTLTTKALKKNPLERYDSVAAFGDDIRRYLAHQPISARPDTLTYRAAKFVRRNRVTVALGALAFAVAVAGSVGTLMQARTARRERDFALHQLERAEAINDLNSFLLSDAAPSGKPFTVTELLQRAEHIVERQQDKRDDLRVEILVSIGRQYNAFDQQAKSRQLLQEAYDLSRGLNEPTIRARAACSLAVPLAYGGDLARAEALAQEGLKELGNEPQFALDRINCLLRDGDVAQARGDVKKRLEMVQAARRAARQSPLPSGFLESQLLIEVAGAYSAVGRYSDANAAFSEASSRLAALGRDDTGTAATLYNNWGLALFLSGRSLEAERVYRRAMDIERVSGGDEAVSPMLLVNYARTLSDLKRLKEAEDYADRGYAKAQQAGAHMVVEQCALLRAVIYIDLGELPRANAVLDDVEPTLRKALPPGHIAFGVLASDRALLAAAQGDLPAALKLCNEAVGIGEAVSKSGKLGGDYLPTFLTRRSETELKMHSNDQAQLDASRAASLIEASLGAGTISNRMGRAQLALGRALQAQGKLDQAGMAFRSATQSLEASLGGDHPDTLAARQLAGQEPKLQ